MNIRLIRLLLNGKLGYLRNGWIKTYNVDPLVDYLSWLMKTSLVSIAMAAIVFFACMGIFHTITTVVEPHLSPDFKKSDGMPILFIYSLVGVSVLLTTKGFFTSVRKSWWKSFEFKNEVDSLANMFIPDNDDYYRVYRHRFEFFVGNPAERIGKVAEEIPLSVRRTLMESFVDIAKEIINQEKQSKGKDHEKCSITALKECLKLRCLHAYHLGLLSTADPQWCYRQASMHLGTEQKPEAAEVKA